MSEIVSLDDHREHPHFIDIRVHRQNDGTLEVYFREMGDLFFEHTKGLTNCQRLEWMADKMPELAERMRAMAALLRADGEECE